MFGGWLKRSPQTVSTSNNAKGDTSSYLIDLRDVVKTYQSAAGSFTALKNVDLQVNAGEFVAVIGKSGSGKSTLINMISGIDRPTSGEVIVANTPVHRLSEGQMAIWRGRNLGIIFQFFQLLPTLSVIENVMLPMDFCNMYTPRVRRERAMHLLEQVDMTENAYKLPSAISGGQQQRVAIARALANDPPIVIADEPTGNLDSRTASSVFRLFEGLIDEGKTILMVTHDNDLARRATRSVIVADGEIVNQYVAQALAKLNVDQLTRVSRQIETRTFAPGATIFHQGELADNFFIITRGEVEIVLHHPDGQEIIVDRLKSGQFFGEVGLVQNRTRTATVRATPETEVEVAILDQNEFHMLVNESELIRNEINQTIKERARPDVARM